MCLKRWAFCNISVIPGIHSWKKYYLHRSNLESKMTSGQPSVDYTCKAIRGHNGMRNVVDHQSNIFRRKNILKSFLILNLHYTVVKSYVYDLYSELPFLQ